MHVAVIEIIYLDSFGVEHVPKELEKIIEYKNRKTTYLGYNQTIQ